MARPYSLDLRERVVAAVESSRSDRDVASRFGVAVSSVVKWSQRNRVALRVLHGHSFMLEAGRSWSPTGRYHRMRR